MEKRGTTMVRKLRKVVTLAVTAIALAAPAMAQSQRPLTLVVPNAPGGGNDLLARALARGLEATAKRSVVVENKAGGGTYVGSEFVARSPADGSTLLVNAYSGLYHHLFTKGINVNLVEELAPVAALSDAPFLVYGPASLPVNDLRQFVAYAKERPMVLNAAVFPAAASSAELLAFFKTQGIKLEAVPFNSTGNILTAMLRGDVHIYNGAISSPRVHLDAGTIKPYAVLSEKRVPEIPNVPTARELGLDWTSALYTVVLAPRKTPPEIIATLNAQITSAINEQGVRDQLNKIGMTVAAPATPAQMSARLKREYDLLKKAASDAGIVPK